MKVQNQQQANLRNKFFGFVIDHAYRCMGTASSFQLFLFCSWIIFHFSFSAVHWWPQVGLGNFQLLGVTKIWGKPKCFGQICMILWETAGHCWSGFCELKKTLQGKCASHACKGFRWRQDTAGMNTFGVASSFQHWCSHDGQRTASASKSASEHISPAGTQTLHFAEFQYLFQVSKVKPSWSRSYFPWLFGCLDGQPQTIHFDHLWQGCHKNDLVNPNRFWWRRKRDNINVTVTSPPAVIQTSWRWMVEIHKHPPVTLSWEKVLQWQIAEISVLLMALLEVVCSRVWFFSNRDIFVPSFLSVMFVCRTQNLEESTSKAKISVTEKADLYARIIVDWGENKQKGKYVLVGKLRHFLKGKRRRERAREAFQRLCRVGRA